MADFKIKNILLIAIAAAVLIFGVALLNERGVSSELAPISPPADESFASGYKITTVTIGGQAIRALLADTTEKITLGLGGRNSLPKDAGMIFVFDHAASYPFWMKGMKFSIDIIWIGDDFRITDIKADASPDSFPENFWPAEQSRYVLEVNAGFSKKFGISIGNQVKIADF